MAYQTVNPYDNQIVATFDDLTDEQAMDLLAQAQKTFESWSQTSFAERTAVISRAAAILRERSDEFARLLTLEMGKLYSEALGEVELSAQILDYYAVNAEKFLAPEPLDTGSDDNAMLVSAPLGVILGVQPWNFPYYQLARVAGPNLMAGNVVIVKHASNVPQAAAAFEKLLLEAGAPAGGYTNLYATKDQINLLIDDPRVRGVALTGSEGAGAVVAARAGKNLKKSTMELGGSDAFIALADCDLDKTVEWAVHGRVFNGGQCCVASKRIVVVDEIADEFLAKFQVAMSELRQAIRSTLRRRWPRCAARRQPTTCMHRSTLPWKPARKRSHAARRCPPRARSYNRPSSPTSPRTTPPTTRSSSARWHCSSASRTRTKPCGWPTTHASGWADRSLPATSSTGSRSPSASTPAW